jgi:hypothetical protein
MPDVIWREYGLFVSVRNAGAPAIAVIASARCEPLCRAASERWGGLRSICRPGSRCWSDQTTLPITGFNNCFLCYVNKYLHRPAPAAIGRLANFFRNAVLLVHLFPLMRDDHAIWSAGSRFSRQRFARPDHAAIVALVNRHNAGVGNVSAGLREKSPAQSPKLARWHVAAARCSM